jgi:AraC family transcriptional regulator, transcriptional activator of pobA
LDIFSHRGHTNMPRAQRAIPQYSLYGESIQDVDERFLHVESIAERSRLHNWTIQPHAHRDLHHLLFLQRGGGTFHADSERLSIVPPALIAVPLWCVHGFDFRPATDGWIVTASGALMNRIVREHPSLNGVLNEAGVVALTADAAATMVTLCKALAEEFLGHQLARRTAAEAWLTTILVQALRVKHQRAPDPNHPASADAELAARYRALVEANFSKSLRIIDYAERLCVSHERLRQACVRTTASSPLQLLNARRLLEAKRSLLYTGISVGLIAEYCGFDDRAYFSRFFARATGKSPLQYRKQQGARHRDD